MKDLLDISVNLKTCPYCGDCGGCDYIDTPYSQTLQIKLKEFQGLIASKLSGDSPKIVESPKPTNYRTRCQLQISNGVCGFFKKKSHELVEIQECLMLDKRLNDKIKSFKFQKNYDGKIELYIKDNVVCERIVEKKYDNQFTQVNEAVNKLLVAEAIKLLGPTGSDKILELYCGFGNFSFAIMEKEPTVKLCGIDVRTKHSTIKGLEFIEADVEEGLKTLEDQKKLSHYNKLLMDPPRVGVKPSVLNKVLNLKLEKIVYVSCNPEELIKDADRILSSGFKWQSCTLFDMFPFSKHVESLNFFTSVK